MKITIDFDKKRISVIGDVNLQELLDSLEKLNINLVEYTLEQNPIYSSLTPRTIFGGSNTGTTQPYSDIIGGKGLNNKVY